MSKYLFIFAITMFFLLSITGAGIFLNDEWIVAQQMNQLSQGHQVLYNEGKYGYFMNGTSSEYMISRENVLIYSMATPIFSLPAYLLFTLLSTSFTRYFIMILWFVLGIYCWSKMRNSILSDISIILLTLLSAISIIISEPFPMTGKFIPFEIIPIVFTNIILLSIFSVIIFKMSELLFTDKIKIIVAWIASLSLSSLLFWAGTLKDHVLLSTIIALLCYFQILYIQKGERKYQIYALLTAGFSAWVRPEVGLFVSISLVLYNLYYMRRGIYDFLNMILWIFIGSIPLFLNNLIVMGNPLKSPFLLAMKTGLKANITSGNMVEVITTSTEQIPFAQLTETNYEQWGKLLFSPESGALGSVVMLSLFIFSLITIIKYRQKISKESKLLLTIGIGSLAYYLLFSGAYLGRDGGVIPDIRYLTPAYALFTLFALSILPYEINYRKVLKNFFITLPIVLILSLCIISAYTPIGETYRTFRIIPEIISVISLAIMIIYLINDRGIKTPVLERVIPLAISSALSWQIIMIFIYHTSKAHYYPMFIPITEFIYKIIFGG